MNYSYTYVYNNNNNYYYYYYKKEVRLTLLDLLFSTLNGLKTNVLTFLTFDILRFV